jgi:hypothetical protein
VFIDPSLYIAPAAGLFAPKPATPAAATFTGERPARGEARAPYEYRSGPSSSSANLFGAKPAVSTPAAPSGEIVSSR